MRVDTFVRATWGAALHLIFAQNNTFSRPERYCSCPVPILVYITARTRFPCRAAAVKSQRTDSMRLIDACCEAGSRNRVVIRRVGVSDITEMGARADERV